MDTAAARQTTKVAVLVLVGIVFVAAMAIALAVGTIFWVPAAVMVLVPAILVPLFTARHRRQLEERQALDSMRAEIEGGPASAKSPRITDDRTVR